MNGIHDCGGMHGLGPVVAEKDEPVFHEPWEGRAFALFASTFVFAGYSVDEFRHSIENMAPAHYLESSYYEHWMVAFEAALIKRGFVSREELDARIAAPVGRAGDITLDPRSAVMLLTPELVPMVVASGASARVAVEAAPRFAVGQTVRVRNLHPVTHTRLPGYLRGHLGVVEIDHGVFVFPDTHAHGLGEKPQHCYSVRFAARELWGPSASAHDTLRVDLFDDYLDPA